MATRVFELARELGVKSKAVLEKCRAEGLSIKNHMTALSAGQEASIREWFSADGGGEHTSIETSEHPDVKKLREQASKDRRRRKAEQAKAEADAGVAVAEPEAETDEPAQDEPAPAETEPAVAAEAAPPAEASDQTVEHPPTETPAPAFEEPAQPAAEEPGEPAQPPAVAAEAPEPTQPQAAPPEPEAEPEPSESPAAEESDGEEDAPAPAGPQVVPEPAKLQGPRVVRFEAPEVVPLPRSRPKPRRSGGRGPGPAEPPAPIPTHSGGRRSKGGPEEESDRNKGSNKKKSKRSPRRRGGRSADSGERLREWREADLRERSERLAAATGGIRRHRRTVGGSRGQGGAGAKTGKVEIAEPITVKDLSATTGIKSGLILKKLMGMGQLANINQVIATEDAETIMADFDIDLVVKRAKTAQEEVVERFQEREAGELQARPPVVTVLGHVDHGKTSLLDYIRGSQVADGEAGGITQHTGAYRYDKDNVHVVFLDTPGHEAFTAMRSRGANMTDVIVLVVAADDGVMPQTVESINHAKAAEVPIVVALNKIDVPNANVQRALGQLAEHGLQPREWGGDTEVIHTSAITGEGVDDLVETLSLEAELLELKAEPDAPAQGHVIESEMDPGRGAIARILVLNGTLRVGDVILAGPSYGRVRAMVDSHGNDITEAGPATPVEISGLDGIAQAGDKFYQLDDIDEARSVAEERRSADRQSELASTQRRSLQDLLGQLSAGETSELALIVKADVQGTMEALRGQLGKVQTDEAKINIIHAGVGGVTSSDVTLAEASNALIIAFNVVADSAARRAAEAAGVDIRSYRVIYELIEDIRKALEEGLAPEIQEETLGRAEVRQTFKISRLGTIAGCFVLDGIANRNAKVRITRDNIVIEDNRSLDSLKRFKDDVREVRAGMECGLKLAGYDDIKEGDILEFYQKVEVARTL